jgi:hypothetical protein
MTRLSAIFGGAAPVGVTSVAIFSSGQQSEVRGSSVGPLGVRTMSYRRRHAPGGLLWLCVSALGIAGFVGALVASFYLPERATMLRIAAFGWFVCLGAVRVALFWDAKLPRPRLH